MFSVRGRLFLVVFLLAFASLAMAQEESAGESKASEKKKKTTTINFEDQLVRGEVQKPELFYLLQKKQFNFGRLIKLRENFLPEMRKTAEDIR